MSALAFTQLFLFFLFSTYIVRVWLAARQLHTVKKHRNSVPEQFADRITLSAHQKAAAYTIAKTHLGLVSLTADTAILLGFTLFGGLQYLAEFITVHITNDMIRQIVLIFAVTAIVGVLDLPFDYYRQFVIEKNFGFNKMTLSLYLADMIKNSLLSMIIGLPLLWILLFMMDKAGTGWWFYTWIFWCAFQCLMLFIYPAFIAPLFNKFSPLTDEKLRNRIEQLMQRVGFQSKGVYIMDGSKRSSHGNAYFTGFGSAKRIVFFDTLIERLSPEEIEAVLAHELGHFRLKHVFKRIIATSLTSLAFLALLGFLKNETWFYVGLGITPDLASNAVALILFALTFPLFTFFLSPVLSMSSRKHEFEADTFSAENTCAGHLVSALVKMYEDNASTLTPDPLHSAFYDSHPPASIRIRHLLEHS